MKERLLGTQVRSVVCPISKVCWQTEVGRHCHLLASRLIFGLVIFKASQNCGSVDADHCRQVSIAVASTIAFDHAFFSFLSTLSPMQQNHILTWEQRYHDSQPNLILGLFCFLDFFGTTITSTSKYP